MKDLKELVDLNKALQSRFKREQDFIDDAKKIIRGILNSSKLKDGEELSVADLKKIDTELKKITDMLNTEKPFESDAKLAKVVDTTFDNATQYPQAAKPPPRSNQNKQPDPPRRSEPKYVELEDHPGWWYIGDHDEAVKGDGPPKPDGFGQLPSKTQLQKYGSKQQQQRAGRKSRRLRRTKF